jgi:hypothetical protein
MVSSDLLESFLVAELARDDFETAQRYVRTIPDARKFACLIQMAAALSERN